MSVELVVDGESAVVDFGWGKKKRLSREEGERLHRDLGTWLRPRCPDDTIPAPAPTAEID